MPTHYQGTEEERSALNLFISVARGSEALFSRIHYVSDQTRLTPSQFGVLETLYHLGPLTSSQIAEKHLRSRNALSVVIRNLEVAGLVVRETCPNDRRAHWIELSEHGRVTIETLFPVFLQSLVQECSVLTEEEQGLLRELMKKLGKGRQTS